jgi:hypothetical protein
MLLFSKNQDVHFGISDLEQKDNNNSNNHNKFLYVYIRDCVTIFMFGNWEKKAHLKEFHLAKLPDRRRFFMMILWWSVRK